MLCLIARTKKTESLVVQWFPPIWARPCQRVQRYKMPIRANSWFATFSGYKRVARSGHSVHGRLYSFYHVQRRQIRAPLLVICIWIRLYAWIWERMCCRVGYHGARKTKHVSLVLHSIDWYCTMYIWSGLITAGTGYRMKGSADGWPSRICRAFRGWFQFHRKPREGIRRSIVTRHRNISDLWWFVDFFCINFMFRGCLLEIMILRSGYRRQNMGTLMTKRVECLIEEFRQMRLNLGLIVLIVSKVLGIGKGRWRDLWWQRYVRLAWIWCWIQGRTRKWRVSPRTSRWKFWLVNRSPWIIRFVSILAGPRALECTVGNNKFTYAWYVVNGTKPIYCCLCKIRSYAGLWASKIVYKIRKNNLLRCHFRFPLSVSTQTE